MSSVKQLKSLTTDILSFLLVCTVYSLFFWSAWRFAIVPIFSLCRIAYYQWLLLVMALPVAAHGLAKMWVVFRTG